MRAVRRSFNILAATALGLAIGIYIPTAAQVRAVNDAGILGLEQKLAAMTTTASVMMIGAHPDDEDSALLAYLARGEHARTAYLSLTRGDGGQNIIGPELFEPLGIIRTEELLQARRLDGAVQYFGREFDYGFSKTLAEARSKWDERVAICDTVRAIRKFRPVVVISRFSGTPADGHGQHQYAGYITPLAVAAAADGGQCMADGYPWKVSKFYIEQGFGDQGTPGLKINTGTYSRTLGRSYFELALEGRSQHRSQGEGRIELKGDQFSGMNLKNANAAGETSLFDGIDTSIKGIASVSHNSEEPLRSKLAAVQSAVDMLQALYASGDADGLDRAIAAVYKTANDAKWATRNPDSKRLLAELQTKAADALRLSAGIQIDALSDIETVVPGQALTASLRVFMLPNRSVTINAAKINVPDNWQTAVAEPDKDNSSGPFRREKGVYNSTYKIAVPAGAELTQPYWLAKQRTSDLFTWPENDSRTMPFERSPMMCEVTVNVDGVEITLDQPVEYRFADPARGELRREVNVVPELSVAVDKKLLIVPLSDVTEPQRVNVAVTNNSRSAVTAKAELRANGVGATTAAETADITLKTPGERHTTAFDIKLGAGTKPGIYSFDASAVADAGVFNKQMNVVAYPHIQTHRYYTRSSVRVAVIDLKTEKRNIGYVMGSGDDVPEAIRQMGFDLTMLEEKDLSAGDLSRFDTIVVGIRAAETRPDLVANNGRLLDYVRNGGNVVMQYQRGNWTSLAPFAVNTVDTQRTTAGSIARVVDENAKVTVLDPSDIYFTTPNAITDADLEGWVQERNAYDLVTFDQRYKPLLESHDAGEQENKGGLVRANDGAGTWTYCSYTMFRQLPAGVPGAYRLFANILSQGRGKK